ncbi:right-handed parallel beta-helix repeat-containing protein [Cytobacillus horneckiae]|uniref:glycosyl hydrolase family 28-related protein n=1 Tax=Cytobacillus horneckiae TaxID=549687 RepID=UPI0039A0EF34
MADAPYIREEDLLFETVPKLNHGIDNANIALKKSLLSEAESKEAVITANQANAKSDFTQTQLDQVTGASTIDPAVEQMKVDEEGVIHPSPDARLRSDYEKVHVQLSVTSQDIKDRGVNIRLLGAVGDGVNDDTSSIQQALDVAKNSSKGVTVIIPDGDYLISSALQIFSNTTIKFSDNARLIRGHSGAFFNNWSSGTEDFLHQGNILIEGGVLEGNINQFPSGFNAINLAGGQNFTFKGMEIRDVKGAHAFDLNGLRNVIIDSCRFLGFKLNDDGTGTTSEAIQLSNLTITSFGSMHDYTGEFSGMPTTDVIVTNCTFGQSGTEGTQAYPVAIGNHSAVHNTFNSNIRINNNNFFGMTYAAIRGFKFADTIISENTFEQCARGVYMDSVWGGIADGNKDVSGEFTKIPQAGRNIIISNNLFKNNSAQCVYITGSVFGTILALYDNIKVLGNTVENTNVPAVMNLFHFTWSKNILIENNNAAFGGRIAWFEYCQDFSIGENNTFSDITYDGIVITEQDVGFNFPVSGEPGYDPTINANTIASWYKNKGLTSNFKLGASKINRVARNGLSLYACWGFKIINTIMELVSTATDTDRDAIRIDNGSRDGEIITPTVKKNPSYVTGPGGTNRHAIYVTGSCQNIRVEAGELESKALTINLSGTNVWNGKYYYAPNGNRYKQTVNNSGQPVYTLA